MIKAILDRVVIEIEETKEQTIGGIIIPGTAKSRDGIGVVHTVGKEVKGLKAGDRVIYNTYSQLIERDGQKFRIVKEHNVLALIEPGCEEDIRVDYKPTMGEVNWDNLDD